MSRLFWKFFFAFWLTILLIALTAASVIWLQDRTSSPSEQQLDRHATAFLSSATTIAKHGDLAALRQFLTDLNDLPFPVIYAIDSNNHELLDRNVDPDLLNFIHAQYLQKGNQQAIQQITTKDGVSLLLFAVKPEMNVLNTFTTNHRPPPPDAFRSAEDHRPPSPDNGFGPRPDHPPPPEFISPLYWLLIAITASILFSGLLAWYFTRPIRDLHNAFSEVSRGNLATRLGPVTLNRKDEFAELGAQFDQMVTKLQNLIDAQQNLLNDVSHELRSPLARMQAAIGIAQQQPDKSEATYQRLEIEIQQISELIGELLVLSQVDTVENSNEKQVIDFIELMSEIVDDGIYEGTDKHIQIDFKHDDSDIKLIAYTKLLRRAIENIIRNAIKFSPENSIITVNIEKQQHDLVITVSDQGHGVKQQNLSSIFEPFFHCDSQNNGGSGLGLGLAIASRAIKKHNGSIHAQNNPNGGLVITIRLPL